MKMVIMMEKNIMKKIIISGVSPGSGGVGNYMIYLMEKFPETKFVYPSRINTPYKFLNQLFNYFTLKILPLRILLINKKDVLILAQQYLSIKSMKHLIINNKASIYFMDNSFFCVKAYNYLSSNKGECFSCLNGKWENIEINKCQPQPSIFTKKKLISINQLILDNKHNINFITLSKTNKNLLEKHLGSDITINYSYFLTKELLERNKNNLETTTVIKNNFDFVFHGSDIESKGFNYFIDLAKLLPEFTFFAPSTKKSNIKNLTFKNFRWESGLQKVVEDSKIILTPSLWSNTPEAAMLKSLKYNGCVGFIDTEFGFGKEMDENSFISLTGDSIKDSALLKSIVRNKDQIISYKLNGSKYYDKYVKNASKHVDHLLDY
jgi:hypothetical protein